MKKEDIVFLILAIIAIIILIWYIFGDSPTMEQVILGLIVANLGFSFKLSGDFQKHLGEHKGYRLAKLNSK